jgi:hypothetical protein
VETAIEITILNPLTKQIIVAVIVNNSICQVSAIYDINTSKSQYVIEMSGKEFLPEPSLRKQFDKLSMAVCDRNHFPVETE